MDQKSHKGWSKDDGFESWDERFSLTVNLMERFKEEVRTLNRNWLLALSLYLQEHKETHLNLGSVHFLSYEIK